MRLFLVLSLFTFIACTPQKKANNANSSSRFQPYIDSVTREFAPDKRTALFAVEATGNMLKGETNLPQAKQALMNSLQAAGMPFVDSIQLLPDAQLQQQTYAVVTLSVVNLRTHPEHKAELATQATMGTPLHVWKKQRGWYLVQTPDKYLAWVEGDAFARMDSSTFVSWQKKPKLIYTNPYGFAYNGTIENGTVSDLVYGNVMALTGSDDRSFQVMFPDGRKGMVLKNEATVHSEWRNSRQPTAQNMIESAKRMMGIPYLWGGTSFKGVDCSGFTKTVYQMNGLVLPRDASQQVMVGEQVDTRNNWSALKPGDLLFFGSPADGTRSERVVHVGMWIGNNEFIHSAGKVRISSMDPSAANYDVFERNRFLRAKHISPEASLIDLRVNDIYEWR